VESYNNESSFSPKAEWEWTLLCKPMMVSYDGGSSFASKARGTRGVGDGG